MDERISRHAEILVDWSMEIEEGDNVLVQFGDGGKELADAVAGRIAGRGGQPLLMASSEAADRAFLLEADDDTLETQPDHLRALAEATDVFCYIRASGNTRAMADVPSDRMQTRSKATNEIREIRLSKRWCLTMHPTPALAQEAGMSTEGFADLFYDMVLIDWAEFAKEVQRVAGRFEGRSEVHIVGEQTDIYLPVKDRPWVASVGHKNMPSGEAFSAPHETSVEGHVRFDLPSIVLGREVQGLYLEFEQGEVVDWSADRGEDAIDALLDTDEGARRLGEVGIGMNRGLDRPTKNILLDEKMGGTIHLALGRAYKENKGTNESAVHQDFIKTMGEESYIAVDGDVVQRGGTFWYEDGF